MTAAESNRSHYRAVILTAIKEEYQAVRKHLENLGEQIHPQGTVYEVGLFQSRAGNWDVLIAQVGKGNPSAAVEAERTIQFFEPQVALFVGVAGGVKDVSLGDVVAATKIYGYESGKAGNVFEPRGEFGQATYRAAQRAKAIAGKTDWLSRIKLEISGNAPEAFAEPIAAGEKVVADTRAETYRFIRSKYGDALAVEMEGLGFLKATHANAGVDALVIRGISDLIDKKSESDAAGSQPIAADRASAFAFEVLATIYRGDTAALPSKALALSELERESRARCSVRWQAAGLSASESASLASDPNVGDPSKELKSEIGSGLTFLVGDLGIGKSLAIERLFQIAVNRARMETGVPIPVYLEAKSIGGEPKQSVESRALRIGDPKNTGVILFIDGLEEPGPERAHEIIDQTRLMLGLWPNSSAVISTRSMSMLNRIGSCRKIEPLNTEDALALVNRIGNTR